MVQAHPRSGLSKLLYAAVLVAAIGASSLAQAQAPAGAPRQPARGANGQAIPQGMGAGASFGSAEIAALIFDEKWNNTPNAQPITPAHLTNKDLSLHLYGDTQMIRKSAHPTENYTYTGESRTNWALTLSDPKSYWDLSGSGKVMLRTRNTGYRFTHVVIKTADGKFYASEEGSGESSSWMNVEYVLSDLHWRNLLMTDTPSNASNQRKPDPAIVPIIPTTKATPDLTKVEEVGFSDLMPGGWIPATTRVNEWAVYGKKVPR